MDLTELQVELRSIEEHISLLYTEIEKMKPRTIEEKQTDFDKITKLAKQHSIKNNTMQNMPIVCKKSFVKSLAYLMLTDEKDVYSRLLYLNRIAIGGGLDITAEDIYKRGLEFEINDVEKLCEDLKHYKHTYIVEAFIIANISGNAPVDMISLIADIAIIMGCDKEEICVMATVAKAKLQNDLDVLLSLPVPSKHKWSNCFSDYIEKEWLISQRRNCGLLCVDKYESKYSNGLFGNTAHAIRIAMGSISEIANNEALVEMQYDIKHPCVVKEQLQTGQFVKKGDVIISYEEEVEKVTAKNDSLVFAGDIEIDLMGKNSSSAESVCKQIIAPCDGVVCFIDDFKLGMCEGMNDKYLAVYVVSYFDDYKEFCDWYISK